MARMPSIGKIVGGKFYLSKWVIEHFWPRYQDLDYGEYFGGLASVLINKRRSRSEHLNDFDSRVYHLLVCVRSHLSDFVRSIGNLRYSEETFREQKLRLEETTNPFEIAIAKYCVLRMSRAGLGRDFAWSTRLRGGQPGDLNAWQNAIKNLPKISERLQNVEITNLDAIELLQKNSRRKDLLIYLDPPYHPNTRTSGLYPCELDENGHARLAQVLIQKSFKPKVLLSGYNCPDYEKWYCKWTRHEKIMVNHAAQTNSKQGKEVGGAAKKVECLWTNF